MRILLIEPFFSGSHKSWAASFQLHSQHDVQILSLPGRYWKWRMYGGAVSLALKFNELKQMPHLIIVSDMLDLVTFVALTKNKIKNIPIVAYFHENQLTYPWSSQDKDVVHKRDEHYVFKNYTSALAADKVCFNSYYHMHSFMQALHPFLKQFPDYNETHLIKEIKEKSRVLYPGIDLKRFDAFKPKKKIKNEVPIILWNHRWEYDKNPQDFFNGLMNLSVQGAQFKLVVLGEKFKKVPDIFDTAQKKLKKHIIHFNYVNSFEEYAKWLWKADILPVTNKQDFFGISILEAVYCGAYPLLPQRLTYPELFQIEENPDIFYKKTEELESKVAFLLKNMNKLSTDFFKNSAIHDWTNVVNDYDDFFEKIKKI